MNAINWSPIFKITQSKMQLIINIPTALMKTNDIAKNTPTKTMCLKRNKNAFHLSTAALSTSLQNN